MKQESSKMFPNALMAFGLLLLATCACVETQTPNLYENYKVVSVQPETQVQIDFLRQLRLQYTFLAPGTFHRSAKILASPLQLEGLVTVLKSSELQPVVKVQNIAEVIELERKRDEKANPKEMSWTAFHTYDEIADWLENEIGKTTGDTYVEEIGTSTENRKIYAVDVTTGPDNNNQPKPMIYIDANIHANEWISSAVATYIINELTYRTGNYSEILDKFDFRIVPMLNPDGYVHTHTTDRMWRKTRSENPNSECFGVDPNRNFEYNFGGESTDTDPCSDEYLGDKFFSEPETKALADDIKKILSENPNRIHAYFTMHSWGDLWLLPWGFARNAYPKDYEELLHWAKLSTDVIHSVHGRQWTYGQGAEILYAVGGASDDWVKSRGVPYVTTLELRGAEGDTGFIIPPREIILACEETWKGIQVVATLDTVDSSANAVKNSLLIVPLFALLRYLL